MNHMQTRIVKAKEFDLTFALRDIDYEDRQVLQALADAGPVGYQGSTRDVKVTSCLTVHNVLAISSLNVSLDRELSQNFLRGNDEYPQHARVTISFIIDAAKIAKPFEENLIEAEAVQLSAPVKALR